MKISRDGNLTITVSEQFAGGGALGKSYSNSFGAWEWKGWREITAMLLDIAYDRTDGTFSGLAAWTAWLSLNKCFDTATLTCDGAIFPLGVDPFESGAAPIEGSELHCVEVEFHRIGVNTDWQVVRPL